MLSHLVAANRLWRESPCKRISNNFTTRKTKEIPNLAAQLNASSKEVDQWGDLTALCSVHICRECLLLIPVVSAHGKSHWLLTTQVQQLASKIWRFSRNQHFLRTLRLGSSKIWRFSCNQHLLRTWTQEKNLVRNSGARFLQILFSKIWRLSCNQHLLRTYTLEKNLVKYFGSKISSNVVDFLARFLQMLLII